MKSGGRFLIRRGPKAETAERTNQKRYRSVLFQRAVIFALIVMVVALLAGLPVYHLADQITAAKNAGAHLSAQMDVMQDILADRGAISDEYRAALQLLDPASGFYDFTHGYFDVYAAENAEANAAVRAAYDGAPSTCMMRLSGEKLLWRYERVDSRADDACYVMAIAAPVEQFAGSAWASTIGLFMGCLAAFIAGWPLSKALILPIVNQIAELRDVALAVTGGDFDAHASEQAIGEIGEAGRALNNLSHQLSRNMYLLIVERNRLKHMLDGLSEGIIAIDADGSISHINPAISRMFEQHRIALGFPDPRMKHLPDKSVWEDFDAVMRTGEAVTRDIVSRDMNIRITITPIVDEIGSTAGAVGLFSDVTQMERLERTRREYVSNVSHELRTPLTAVRALVEPLKEGMVTREEDRMRYYDIILREVMRLSRLINDQLELSRLQSGSVAIEKRRMALDDLIYDVCDRYSSIAEDSGLSLHIDSDLSDCPTVYANADRVEQMFIILLDNAIKYTEEGSVHVRVEWDAEKVLLTVRDTGIGIADADLPYVFDRFYKVDKAHSGKGSGLGLSIARELLSRMGEEIWVTSEKGKGSAFTFTIHRNPTESDGAEA